LFVCVRITRPYPPNVRPPAEAISALALVVGAIALLIFIGVEGALIYAVLRYRSSRLPAGRPARFERNTRLEIAWTALPAIVLAVVFVLMLGTMAEIGGGGVEPGLRVRVAGHQWWWEFSYGPVTTANEMHIPIGTAVDLDLTSADVIHSFWVPELGGKSDMRAWIADPQQYKPGALMPRVPLSDPELDALAAYLVSLK